MSDPNDASDNEGATTRHEACVFTVRFDGRPLVSCLLTCQGCATGGCPLDVSTSILEFLGCEIGPVADGAVAIAVPDVEALDQVLGETVPLYGLAALVKYEARCAMETQRMLAGLQGEGAKA